MKRSGHAPYLINRQRKRFGASVAAEPLEIDRLSRSAIERAYELVAAASLLAATTLELLEHFQCTAPVGQLDNCGPRDLTDQGKDPGCHGLRFLMAYGAGHDGSRLKLRD